MRATNYVKATYQEVYDISTKQDCVSFMAFHTPTEFGPYHMLHGFFSQYRKYKYGGMKVTVVPAAQLPADPLQVSYEAGESVIDPRDLQNPVLFHGAHGNNMGDVLSFIYGDRATVPTTSVDYYQQINSKPLNNAQGAGGTLEEWYYSSMLDPSFRKFNVMNNMDLPFMSPRVHNLTTNISLQPNQRAPSVLDVVYPRMDLDTSTSSDVNDRDAMLENVIPAIPDLGSSQIVVGRAVPEVQLMSNRLSKLGWMDTFTFPKEGSVSTTAGDMGPVVSPLPKLMMGVLILPPCYKTKLAFRVIISHYFHFYKFNTSITPTLVGPSTNHESQFNENYYSFLPDTSATSLAETNSIDALNGDVKQSFSGVV